MGFNSTQYLFDEKQWWGQWWLPESPDQKKSGILTYRPNKHSQLQIGPGFRRENLIPKDNSHYEIIEKPPGMWKVIHGKMEGEPVTLFESHLINERQSLGSMTKSQDPEEQWIAVPQILVGQHIPSENSNVFTSISMAFEDVTSWLDTLRYKSAPDGEGVTILPVENKISLIEGLGTITFKTVSSPFFPINKKGGINFSSTLKSTITIEFGEPVDIVKIESLTKIFQDFFALASNSSTGILNISACTKLDNGAKRLPLFFPTRGTANPDAMGYRFSQFLFTATAITDLGTTLTSWLELYEEIRPTLDVIFGFRYSNDSQFLESQVIALVSAAEALSNRYEIINQDHPLNEPRNIAKNSGNHKLYKTLTEKPILVDRLWGILMQIPDKIRESLIPNPEQFVKKAKDARNGIGHEVSSGVSVDMLYSIARTTELFLVCWIIVKKLGIKSEFLENNFLHALKTNPRSDEAIQSAWEAFPLQTQPHL